MREQTNVQKRILETITRFENTYMSVRPESILVNVHDSYILVILHQAICAAEREYAHERQARELLERLYTRVFDATKSELEADIAKIVGRPVQQSRMNVDTLAGNILLVFLLKK